MKKILSIILVLTTLFISFSVVTLAQTPVTLSLNSETVYAGDEFVVNLFISDNSKVSGAVIDIKYNKDMLEFVSAKEGGILDSSANISIRNIDNKIRFAYMSPSSEITSAGILVSITFKAKDTAKGETSLEICIENDADFVSMDIEKIPYKTKNSTIDIINSVENVTETIEPTEENSTEEDVTENSTVNEENKVDNADNDISDYIVYIVMFVVGVALVAISIVIIVKGKNKKA